MSTIAKITLLMAGTLLTFSLSALGTTYSVHVLNNSSSASFVFLDGYAGENTVFNRIFSGTLTTKGTSASQAKPYYTLTTEGNALASGNLILQPSVNGKVQGNIYCNIGIYNNAPRNSCYNGCICTITSQTSDSMTVTIDYISTTSSEKRI